MWRRFWESGSDPIGPNLDWWLQASGLIILIGFYLTYFGYRMGQRSARLAATESGQGSTNSPTG